MASNTLLSYMFQAPCASLGKLTEFERVTRIGLADCKQRWPMRLVRRVEHGQSSSQAGRMSISGSMDDVCAQIDQLIAQAAFKP